MAQADAFVASSQEQALIRSIDAAALSPFRFHGWSGKRLTASFGWRYDFETASFGRTDPIRSLIGCCPCVKASGFARLKPDDLVQALLIRYDPGAGIGWHRDRPLPGARTLRFRAP